MKRWVMIGLALLMLFPVEAARKSRKTVVEATTPAVRPALSEQDRQAFDYYLQQAINFKYQERYAEAFELFQHCTLIDSLDPQPWYELSSFYRSLNQVEQAMEAMGKAHKLEPANEWYAFGLANLYLAANKVNDAIVLYENLLQTRPDDENLLYQLAGMLAKTEDYKGALTILDKVERLIGKNEAVSFEKYKAYKAMGQPKKAIKEIESLKDEFPYDADFVLLLGDAWMDLGQPKKAFPVYMEAKRVDPSNPGIALSLADYYNAIGDTMAASDQLLLALANPDTEVPTKLEILTPLLVRSLQGELDSTTVMGYFNQLLEQHPTDYQIRELYVQWLLERGRKQEAKDELRTVLDLNPNQLKAWRNYLELNLEADNQEVIRDICQEALTYFPNEALFWFYYGLSWSAEQPSGKPDPAKSKAAIEAYEKAIEVADPADKGFVSRLYGLTGDTYLLQGDTLAAFDFYEKALAAFAGNVLVLNNYAYYLALSGKDLSKAERMARKAFDAEPRNATYLDTFAWVFFKQGQFSLARIYIERALEYESEPGTELLEHYGDILWFNGDLDGARIQWKKAAQLENPNDALLQKVETGQYID
ncbi:MAG: tetratricopeptide repeat protein [Bacteroidales bacterium]|nr:tetratricopeptide repeat protein [Bacteroidales bacterium]